MKIALHPPILPLSINNLQLRANNSVFSTRGAAPTTGRKSDSHSFRSLQFQ
jgi:hypothetical protein